MADVEALKAQMDSAAVDAENDLNNVDPDALAKVATWWKRWFKKAGHKRLGRILVQYAPKEPK